LESRPNGWRSGSSNWIRSRTAPPRSDPDRSRDARVSRGVLPDVGLALGGAVTYPVRAARPPAVWAALQGAEGQAHDAARPGAAARAASRSEEHTSELQSQSNLVCRLLLEKKKKNEKTTSKSTDG